MSEGRACYLLLGASSECRASDVSGRKDVRGGGRGWAGGQQVTRSVAAARRGTQLDRFPPSNGENGVPGRRGTEDDLHGACRTGGIVEADRDPHARLRELLQRRGSAGLLDGFAGRDGGMGRWARVVELNHGGVLGDCDLERAIAEVDRGAQYRTGIQAESAERHGPGGSPHERRARGVPRMRALGTRIPVRRATRYAGARIRWRSVANTPASVRAPTPGVMVKARAHLVHGGIRCKARGT